MNHRVLMRDVRNDMGLTMKQAAQRANISESHWSYIESGRKTPSIQVAGRISRVLGEPATDLFAELAQALGEGA